MSFIAGSSSCARKLWGKTGIHVIVCRWHLVKWVHVCSVCSQAVSWAAQRVTSQLLCYWCIYIFLIYWTRWTLHFLAHPFPVQSSQREKKTSLLNIFFRMAPCQSWGAWKHRRKSLMQCLSCRRFKDLFCSFFPSPTNLLPVSLPVEVRGGCKKFQLRRQRLSHLAAVQNSIACFQKPVCLPAGRVWKGHATLRPCLGEREIERERERWGKATRHGSALPTLPYLAEQLFTG